MGYMFVPTESKKWSYQKHGKRGMYSLKSGRLQTWLLVVLQTITIFQKENVSIIHQT